MRLLEKSRLWEEHIAAFQYLLEAYKKGREKFLLEHVVIGQEITILN